MPLPPIAIFRIIIVFVISFLAYKFLDILFDLIKSHIREKNNLKDINAKNPEIEIIETEFIEKENESEDGDEDKE